MPETLQVKNTLQTKLAKRVNQVSSGEWIEKVPAILGRQSDHSVATGYGDFVWVRFPNGQEKAIRNRSAPLTYDLQVMIGRSHNQPTFWQVVDSRETFLEAATTFVKYHHEQHEFPNPDTVFIRAEQDLNKTILVKDAENFIIIVPSAVVLTRTGMAVIEKELDGSPKRLDLSSYIPTTSGVYIGVEYDDDGLLSLHEGTPFDAPDLTGSVDVPVPEAGKYPRGLVLLTEGMTYLPQSNILVYTPSVYNPANVTEALGDYVKLTTDQTVAGIKTFTSFPVTPSSAPSANYQVANKKYVDDSIPVFAIYSPLTNGDPSDPQLIFDVDGDVIIVPA